MEAKGIIKDSVKDFVKDSTEDTAKENNKGVTIVYNTYINKKKRSIGFRVFILVIQYIKL